MSTILAGVDIGFDSIKVVGLQHRGRSFRLVGLNHATISPGSWDASELKNREEIAKTLATLMRTSKPAGISTKKITLALPESVIFSGTFAVPLLPPKELAQAVPFEIAEKLSINLEEYHIDYEYTNSSCQPMTEGAVTKPAEAKKEKEKGKKGEPEKPTATPTAGAEEAATAIFAVAAKKTLVQSILELGELAHLEIVGLDIKPGAIGRAVVKPNDKQIRLIIDLGASATGVSVVEGQSLRLTSSVPLGTKSLGDDPTHTLKMFQAKAEPIFDEVLHITKFFENRVCPGMKIEQIILTGGGSNIEGISNEFLTQTGLPTVTGEPFSQIDTHHFPIDPQLARTFADAAGLAMRTPQRKQK